MRPPRILLIGIGGVYNYGCEAIVRGTEAILRSAWPDVRIVYASRRADDDKRRLQGSSIEVVDHPSRGRYSATNIMRKLLSFMGIRWDPMSDSAPLLVGHDAVLSIGGDIYTLGASGKYGSALPRFGAVAERRGIPYILWGASVGPFTGNLQAEAFFGKHLSSISLITARERGTVHYLASIGVCSNVVPCADPAFSVAPEIVKNGTPGGAKKKTVAINLSPLSVRHIGLGLADAVASQAKMIERIIRTWDVEVLLVPHVVCGFSEYDDDLRYLQRIEAAVGGPCRKRVRLLDTDPGFVGTKRVLAECELVIAARMHCAINAMTAHVPTLLLAYSQKAQGMAEYIYGHGDWILMLSDFCSDEGLSTIGRMLDMEPAIHAHLTHRIPEVRADVFYPLTALRRLLV